MEDSRFKEFALASAKMQISSRLLIHLLRQRVGYLESRLALLEGQREDVAELVEKMDKHTDETLSELDEHTEKLLMALEKLANG